MLKKVDGTLKLIDFRIKPWLFVFSIILVFQVSAQLGCTDPSALNYDNSASVNDGSCLYPAISLTCPVVGNIPSQVYESSGLALFDSRLWTHNDSDNSPKLFGFDTINFQIQDTLVIGNQLNIDWEDLTVSSDFIFIGDFGNNSATRTDLRILRIDLTDMQNADTVNAQEISFYYPDQINFEPSGNHGFDCEAFFYFNDSLHLFTKHWGNGYTKHYVLPNEIGNHAAVFVDSLLVNGQVTSAAISSSGTVALLGYSPPGYTPFIHMLWDYEESDFFAGNKRRIDMGSVLTMGQQEGIVFSSATEGFISSERISSPIVVASRFFRFDLDPIFNPSLEISEPFEVTNVPYPIPFDSYFMLKEDGNFDFIVRDLHGNCVLKDQGYSEKRVETIELTKGIYFVEIITNRGAKVYKLFK